MFLYVLYMRGTYIADADQSSCAIWTSNNLNKHRFRLWKWSLFMSIFSLISLWNSKHMFEYSWICIIYIFCVAFEMLFGRRPRGLYPAIDVLLSSLVVVAAVIFILFSRSDSIGYTNFYRKFWLSIQEHAHPLKKERKSRAKNSQTYIIISSWKWHAISQ